MNRKIVKSLPEPKPLQALMYELKIKSIIFNKDYQREFVWEDKKNKDELMKSIFLGYPIGVITLWQNNEQIFEVVDGLQRMTIIESFYNGDKNNYYKISGEISKDIIMAFIEQIELDAKAGDGEAKRILDNKSRGHNINLSYDTLPKCLLNKFNGYAININNILSADREDIRSFFRVLQIQEKLKAGEIVNSLLNNELLEYIKSFPNIRKGLFIMAFNNTRQDFQKYIVMYQGIFENKLKLGVTDKKIVSYAESMIKNDSYIKMIEPLLEIINNFLPIVSAEKNYSNRTFNKFSMKLLIGLYVFQPTWARAHEFKDIVQFLYKFSEWNAAFNSIKRKGDVPQDAFDLVSQISLISRTTHSKESLITALEKLINLYELFDIKEIRSGYRWDVKIHPSKDVLGRQEEILKKQQ